MATAAYYTWVKVGRPYTVAQPIQDVVNYAHANNVQWLGTLGSDDSRHLKADRPQDHTPFSVTAWPLALPGYVVTACDLARGPWCERFLAECRAGVHPWVKYINFGGHHYNVKTGWQQESSSDEHFHVSCRTDFLYARALNPFVANRIQEYKEMAGIARDGNTGQLYYCNGMESRPITDAQVGDIVYTSGQGLTPPIARGPVAGDAEWEKGGIVRRGWGESWAGPVRKTAVVSAPPIDVAVATVELGVRNVLRNA